LPWNLEYIFTVKIYIITNKTHNPASNIFQAMPPFQVNFALSKIYTWPITLKLLELSPWNWKYIFTIKIYVIINKTHNSSTNIFQVMPLFYLRNCPITSKQLKILLWNLEYMFAISFQIIINKTYNFIGNISVSYAPFYTPTNDVWGGI
jgi:hypothetical protein